MKVEVGMKVCAVIRVVNCNFFFFDTLYDKSIRPFLSTEIQFQAVRLQFKSPTRTTESDEEKTESRSECRIGKSGGLLV